MIPTLGDGFRLRPATHADHSALSFLCLKTGDAGKDATTREDDPDLLGLIFALPYQMLETDLAFIVEDDDGPAGYLFGARDTASFNARLATEWYPQLQRRIAKPSADASAWTGSDWARHIVHHPEFAVPTALADFPSHGHIDLLPHARGRGIGRKMMIFLEQRLVETGSPGLHLQVDPRNADALAFYRRLGFGELRSPDLPEHSVFVAKRLAVATR